MTARLVALDLPGGPAFVDALRDVWDRGDAAFPVDQRLPAAAKAALLDAMGVGRPVEPGDALVVATSGSTGAPTWRRAHPRRRRRLGMGDQPTARRDRGRPLAGLPPARPRRRARRRHAGAGRRHAAHGAARLRPRRRDGSGATHVSLVATALRRIDPPSFRTIVLGGAAPPADLPPNVVTTYGMTETGSGVVYDGRPLDGVDVRIDDDGQILLRGPMLLRCYRDGSDPLRRRLVPDRRPRPLARRRPAARRRAAPAT